MPEETCRGAQAAVPRGNLERRRRDARGTIDDPQRFIALCPARGQPAEAPWRPAVTTVMPGAEGGADRRAAAAVRRRLEGPSAWRLALTDPGGDPTVLSAFRTRRAAGQAARRRLDPVLARVRAGGLLTGRGRQRPDSTHRRAARGVRHRLARVGEPRRHARHRLAVGAPAWRQAPAPAAWFDRDGRRLANGHVPQSAAAREALAATRGALGPRRLHAVAAATARPW